jgi:hypothetical protein
MDKNLLDRILLVLLLAIILAGTSLARTRRAGPMDLAAKSQHVTIVRCVDAQVVRHESGLIFTRFSFETVDTISGKAAPQHFRLDIAGGTFGQRRLVLHDAPRFSTGKHYAVFLRSKKNSDGLLLTGASQGVFHARLDPESNRWMISLHSDGGSPKMAGFPRVEKEKWISKDEFRLLLDPKGGGQ